MKVSNLLTNFETEIRDPRIQQTADWQQKAKNQLLSIQQIITDASPMTVEEKSSLLGRVQNLFKEINRIESLEWVETLVPGDGHCLFRSCLIATNLPFSDSDVSKLRKDVCAKIREDYPGEKAINAGIDNLEEYVKDMADMGKASYGGQIELISISKLLKVNICCYERLENGTVQEISYLKHNDPNNTQTIYLQFVPGTNKDGSKNYESGHFSVLRPKLPTVSSLDPTPPPARKRGTSSCVRIAYACMAIVAAIYLAGPKC